MPLSAVVFSEQPNKRVARKERRRSGMAGRVLGEVKRDKVDFTKAMEMRTPQELFKQMKASQHLRAKMRYESRQIRAEMEALQKQLDDPGLDNAVRLQLEEQVSNRDRLLDEFQESIDGLSDQIADLQFHISRIDPAETHAASDEPETAITFVFAALLGVLLVVIAWFLFGE